MVAKVLPKVELKRVVRKFIQDKSRGISLNLFADLCGISKNHLLDVFLYEEEPLTEYVQRRVNKGYFAWQRGEVAVMQNRDNTRFVQYRKKAKPVFQRTTGLQVVDGQIKIKLGITNKHDYSQPTLDEQLKRG